MITKNMKHQETIYQVVELIINYLRKDNNLEQKVIDYQSINELKQKLNLSLPEQGISLEKLIPLLELYLRYSVRTGNRQFLNHLWGGFEISGLLAEMITSVSNTSMTLSESSPIALLMEQELIKALNNLVGFTTGEGLMVTGGSNANLISMLCARHKFFPEAKYQGLGHNKLVAFTSDQAHFSWLKAVNVLGIGMDNLIKVKSDAKGRIIPQELALAIKESYDRGQTPFFVATTSGTSVLGAFDPVLAVAKITKKYGLWLHIDGAWGGPVLFSDKHQHLLKGSELADSFTWDAHKLMGVPLVCSAILIKNKGILSQTCSSQGTDYVHDQENANDDYNPIQMSLQCSRKVDSLKLWLSWQYHGSLGYQRMVDHLFELAHYAVEFICQSEHLELILKPEFLNICFRYHPQNTNYSLCVLNKLNLEIRDRLFRSGQSFVNYAHYQDILIIRLILTNPELQQEDLDHFFRKLINVGQSILDFGLTSCLKPGV